jgi:L-cysteine:1D-myo-inositol 2-amino-2-deoxy-alpha-D-glucopyranoside ligase
MRAWTSPTVPSLADLGFGLGGRPRVYDTARDEFVEAASGELARLYVCGITPYDATHMGHAASYVAFDTLQRVWLDAGVHVSYTQNVTDVDDPLIERARVTGIDWAELAERETELFRQDMQSLRVLAPDHYIGAVESIPLVLEHVQQLFDAGAAYQVDGDVYFDVHRDPAFGAISGLDEPTMRTLFAERGGDPQRPGKRNPLDCVVWLAARPGEPSWDSPFGRGRPGWHAECTAIAVQHLGQGFDVQGGGSDLVFPHHEMSAAEASVALGPGSFARAYVHAGMVGYDGAKMSKSLGNLVLVSQLRTDGVEPAAVRLALLAHHYRSDWEWTELGLKAAEERLLRWRDAVAHEAGPSAKDLVSTVRAAMVDDLQTPRALAAVDVWAEATLGATVADPSLSSERDPKAPDAVRALVDALLGVRL